MKLLALIALGGGLAAGPALAQAGDPCRLTPEETSQRMRMELAMVDPPPPPVLIDPVSGQRITGCSVWRLEISASGAVTSAVLLRGSTPGDHVAQAQRWLRNLRFMRFSAGWTGIYLMRPS